ncbi:hypothetical protein M2454_000780 [Aequitasia blattaphilus]|uniref:ImmA/IrrE family metallo-endopeptidase n=1 Tax=Aequitasia blattaphilus TaxID=2949332 RepID=A0ABT1EAK5_9FIRM|nr:ImmA/IrrE family metallo-endopeptidase [Aequitasia blattaphilus]MCP1101987.1 ImmA/IrrE family metallo-endopeptidase [Aequitasia blattaphilus]MCR8614627.1 ImmA/IrrE family metallo-endopeptidase [Aequitasia blattaphilus]
MKKQSYNKEAWKKSLIEKEEKARQYVEEFGKSYQENPERLAELFEFGAKFPRYSYKNQVLIQSQNEFALFVQSFDRWKDEGWHVEKGEKGLMVWVPVTATFLKIDGKEIPLIGATKEQKENYKKGIIEGEQRLRFKLGTVFDISQTDFPKERYPEYFSVGYDSKEHQELTQAIIEFSNDVLHCPVEFSNVSSIALRGMYYPDENKIIINEKLNDTEKLSTLSHELGHALIHQGENSSSVAKKEYEADAVSILLQSHQGIPLSESRKAHFANHYKEHVSELESKYSNLSQLLKEKKIQESLEKSFNEAHSVFKEHMPALEYRYKKNTCKDMKESFSPKAERKMSISKASLNREEKKLKL